MPKWLKVIIIKVYYVGSQEVRKIEIKFLKELHLSSKEVFSLLQKEGYHTKQEICNKMNMKLTTLNRVMKPLEELKLIEEIGMAESTGGRKPSVYGVKPNNYFIIGIDISRTYVTVVICDLTIKIIDKKSFTLDASFSPEKVVKLIGSLVEKAILENNINKSDVLGAGLGTVGPLDKDSGKLLNAKNFEALGWKDVSIKSMLEHELTLPVIIDNGANVALFVEKYYGIAKGLRNVLYINCGIGIRTAACVSNAIIQTHLNKEDVFAHMIVDMDGKECSCGNRGCVECYSTIIAIVNSFKEEMKNRGCTTIKKSINEVDYKDICQGAENGDELAKRVIEKAARIFGIGLVNYINIVNPEMIILSGPLVQHSNYFYELCIETVEKAYLVKEKSNEKKNVVFNKQGYFKYDAISIGAAASFIEECLKS